MREAAQRGRVGGGALLLAGAVAVVVAVLGLAVSVLDSPSEMRRQRLDERRVTDLQDLATEIRQHHRDAGRLPPTLGALKAWRDTTPPTDPETDAPYAYRPTGLHSYELCASFATASPPEDDRRPWRRHGIHWIHPAGRHCFNLEIDDENGT